MTANRSRHAPSNAGQGNFPHLARHALRVDHVCVNRLPALDQGLPEHRPQRRLSAPAGADDDTPHPLIQGLLELQHLADLSLNPSMPGPGGFVDRWEIASTTSPPPRAPSELPRATYGDSKAAASGGYPVRGLGYSSLSVNLDQSRHLSRSHPEGAHRGVSQPRRAPHLEIEKLEKFGPYRVPMRTDTLMHTYLPLYPLPVP